MIMAVSAVLLLHRLGAIHAPIWDESYYIASTARFQLGQMQFASHPPLGLMLIAVGDMAWGGNAGVDWHRLAATASVSGAQVPTGFDWFGLRLASATAGVGVAGLFYALMRQLSGTAEAAGLLSLLWLADSAPLAQFRAGHIDSFQIVFALAALVATLRGLDCDGRRRMIWASIAAAMAMAATLVRANGVVLFGGVGALVWARGWRTSLGTAVATLAAALAMLIGVFAADLALAPGLPDAGTPIGQRDLAALSPTLRSATLHDVAGPALRIGAAVADQTRFIGRDFAGMARTDANGSHPWQWPLAIGRITYRWDAGPDRVAAIAFVPNPVIWWLASAGVIGGIVLVTRRWSLWRDRRAALILLALYGGAMGMFVVLDQSRVLYAYHALMPLVFAHGLLALCWKSAGFPRRPACLALIFGLAGFVAISPVALHRAVPSRWCTLVAPDCGPAAP